MLFYFFSYSFNHFRGPPYSHQTPLNKLAGYSVPYRRRWPSWESPNGHCTSWWLGFSCTPYPQQQASYKQQHSMKWYHHIPHGEGAACWDFPMKMLHPQTVHSSMLYYPEIRVIQFFSSQIHLCFCSVQAPSDVCTLSENIWVNMHPSVVGQLQQMKVWFYQSSTWQASLLDLFTEYGWGFTYTSMDNSKVNTPPKYLPSARMTTSLYLERWSLPYI